MPILLKATPLLLIVGFAFSTQAQTSPASQRDERRAATYAVYSQAILQQNQRTQSDDLFLIQASTVEPGLAIDSAAGEGACVQPPPGAVASFAELVADYKARKGASETLAREFTLSKPYQLLSKEEAQTFLTDALNATPQIRPRNGVVPPNPNPLYPKAKTVFVLGGVYFDKSGTLALSFAGAYQTRYDFMESWSAFRRSSGGEWAVDRTWRACGHGSIR